jgi:type I restriction enzyme S subunit
MKSWPKVSLGGLLRLERRPVRIEPEKIYQEIGIYCFGRGIFHKTPRTGFEVGDKDLYLLKEGDFILQVTFAWEGAVAIVTAAEHGMYGSTRYPTFRVDEGRCEPKFLLNYFKTEEGLQQLVKICPGSAGRNRVLSIKRIPEVYVPLPPLAEQRRVVARIEELAGQIHEARTLRHQAAEEAAVLLPSGMAEIFRRLGEKHPTTKLATLCDVVRGGSPRPAGSPMYYGGNIPFLKVGDLTKDDGMYVYEASATVNEIGREQSRYIAAETLMLTNSGATLGVPKITKFAGCFNDGSQAFLNLDSSVEKEYLYYLFKSKTLWFREQLARGQGQPNLNTHMTKQMDVPVPPLAEQRRIVAELDGLQAEVDALKRLQAETAAELDALLPGILHRAFKGEL